MTGSYLTAELVNYQTPLIPVDMKLVPPTIFFVMLADFSGAITSSLTQNIGGSSQEFLEVKIATWKVRCGLL